MNSSTSNGVDHNVHLAILPRYNLGEIVLTGHLNGEDALRALVSTPTSSVAALLQLPSWPETEKELVASLASATEDERKELKKRIPAWVPAQFSGWVRNAAECLSRQVIGHDFDHLVAETWEAVEARVKELLPNRFLAMHTTATERNADGTWRVRAYEIADRAATPLEWDELVKPHLRSLGEHDPNALDVCRLFFLPISTAGYRFAIVDGPRTRLADLKPAATAPGPTVTKVRDTSAREPSPALPVNEIAAKLLGENWPAPGARVDARLALVGRGYHDRTTQDEAVAFAVAVHRYVKDVGDANEKKFREIAVGAWRRGETGQRVYGWNELANHIPAAVVKAARDMLQGDGAAAAMLEFDGKSERRHAPCDAAPANDTALPLFPVQVLPPALRDFALAQAEFTQVPVDLPAMLALGVCSAAIAGKVDLEVQPGYIEPLNLYIVVALPTGERKTPNFEAALEPLRQVEREKASASKFTLAKKRALRVAFEKTLQKRQSEYANLKRDAVGQECIALEREMAELSERIERMAIEAPPQLLAEDVTPERFASLLAEQGGRMCVASDEGGLFDVLAGRYSRDGKANFDIFLKAYSGSAYKNDRQSKERAPISITRAVGTLLLSPQPSVLEQLSSPAMRSKGLLARFLYSLPVSTVGHRKTNTSPVPDGVRLAYETAARRLALFPTPQEAAESAPRQTDDIDAMFRQIDALALKVPRIRLSAGALDLHLSFREELEPRLRYTGDLFDVIDWTNKWAGNVARIAGVLHCVSHKPEGEVSAETMQSAIVIGKYLLSHAMAAFGGMGGSQAARDAREIWTWVNRSKRGGFTKKDLSRLGPGQLRGEKARQIAALELLMVEGRLVSDGERWAVAT